MSKKQDVNCENCKFDISEDDEQVRCELMKMLGKKPGLECEKFEPK